MSARKIEDLADTADKTRQRLGTRLSELRQRTRPAVLADEVIDYATAHGQDLATRVRTVAAAHPLAIGAGIAAIGLALLARQKLKTARIDLDDQSGDYTDYDDSFATSPEAPDITDDSPHNPLVSVLIGLAAGALMGAITPARS